MTTTVCEEVAALIGPHLADPDHAGALASDVLDLVTDALAADIRGIPVPAGRGPTPIYDQVASGEGC